MILTNVSNGANFCMKLPYFMKEISIFAPKPCILRNLRSKRERSGFSLLNLTVLKYELDAKVHAILSAQDNPHQKILVQHHTLFVCKKESYSTTVLFGEFLWSLINVNLHLRTDNKIGLDSTSVYSKTPRFHIKHSFFLYLCTVSNSWYITNNGAHTYITTTQVKSEIDSWNCLTCSLEM